MGLFIRSGEEDIIVSFRVFEHRGSGNYNRVCHGLGGHRNFHRHARLKRRFGLGRLHPNFDGRASWVESGTDQTNAALDGLVEAGDIQFRRISHFQNRGFRLRNVPFGDEPGGIHYGEQGLIGGSEVAFEKRAIGHYAVDGTGDSRITEQRLGPLHSAFRRQARTLGGLERLLFSNALEVGEKFLRLLVLAAGLQESDFGGVHVPAGNGSLLKQFLATLVDFLLGIEVRLRGDGVQFRLLNLLREAGANRGCVVGFRLVEIALAGLRGGGQITVFQFGEQLALFNSRATLHVEFLNGRADLWGDGGLLERKHHRFRRNYL